MDVFKASESWDWSELVIDFLLKVALLVGLVALSVWLWPNGILDVPAGTITLSDWLWAAAAVWAGMFGLLVFYFLVVEPALSRVNGKTDMDERYWQDAIQPNQSNVLVEEECEKGLFAMPSQRGRGVDIRGQELEECGSEQRQKKPVGEASHVALPARNALQKAKHETAQHD